MALHIKIRRLKSIMYNLDNYGDNYRISEARFNSLLIKLQVLEDKLEKKIIDVLSNTFLIIVIIILVSIV